MFLVSIWKQKKTNTNTNTFRSIDNMGGGGVEHMPYVLFLGNLLYGNGKDTNT